MHGNNGSFFLDQTERFPSTSSKAFKYIMVVYVHDFNAILVKLLKARSKRELIRAMEKFYNLLKQQRFAS